MKQDATSKNACPGDPSGPRGSRLLVSPVWEPVTETVETNIRVVLDEIGMTWEELAGYRAVWRAGGDINELASAAGADKLQLAWLMLMLDTVHLKLPT